MNILSNESCIGEIVRFLNFRVPNPWVRLVRPKIIAQEIYNVKNVYRCDSRSTSAGHHTKVSN